MWTSVSYIYDLPFESEATSHENQLSLRPKLPSKTAEALSELVVANSSDVRVTRGFTIQIMRFNRSEGYYQRVGRLSM